MYPIIKKENITDGIHLFEVLHPALAQKAQAGQFVIIRLFEDGERIPLTIADFDAHKGTITMVVQEVGKTTMEMGQMSVGETILDILGPLGNPSHIQNFGTVICIGGGLGIAPLYPITRSLKAAGNKVITILGARSQNLLFWQDKMASVSDVLHIATDDGSVGRKGLVTDIQKELIATETINKIYAIGPAIMMKFVVLTSKPHAISTIVSLNSIMIDGTGMCGGCRVSVAGKSQFVCVDGPEFEGLDVDFDNLMNRQRFYAEEEQMAKERHTCRIGLGQS